MHRIKRILISVELFTLWLRGAFPLAPVRVENGLPDDAVIVGIYLIDAGRMIEVIIQSASFDAVEDGDTPPELCPTYTRIDA
jgi:hypothetical protein